MKKNYGKLQETDFSAVLNIDCPNLAYNKFMARRRHDPNLLEESLGSHLVYLLHLLIKKKYVL